MIDLSRARRKPYAHQQTGVERLVPLQEPEKGRVFPGCLILADEMRLGKTKQIIDTAQVLFERGELVRVIVVAPSNVRDVWYDPELGEIAKHRWEGLPTLVTEYHSRIRQWSADAEADKPYLTWIVTNYEYIRYKLNNVKGRWQGPYLTPLLKECGPKTMLAVDESAALADWRSLQTRACYELRRRCGRVVEMNGTPIVEDPEDIYAQARLLDQRILGLNTIGGYRAKYAIMGGYTVEKKVGWDPVRQKPKTIAVPVEVIGWRHEERLGCCSNPPAVAKKLHEPGHNLEEIQAKLAPYVLRRLRRDCPDMPAKLDSVALTATLKPETWRLYREMRDELVTWLNHQTVSIAPQAGVKVMRLSQITSGFLGGIVDEEAVCPECDGEGEVQIEGQAAPGSPSEGPNLARECLACRGSGAISARVPPVEVGREKLDVYLDWVKKRLREEPEFRMLTWCRFRPELERVEREVRAAYPGIKVRTICGGQKRLDREEGMRLMHPDVKYGGPAILVGTVGTGSMGRNMAGAHEVVYLSNNPSLHRRLQSEDRPVGPDQTQSISYHDIIAVGPSRQKTVDHTILKGLRDKDNLAKWTCSAWISALEAE